MFTSFPLPSRKFAAGLGSSSGKQCRFTLLVLTVTSCGPWYSSPCTFLIYITFLHFQDPPGRMFTSFFPSPLLLSKTKSSGVLSFQHSLSFPEPLAPIFPKQNSLFVQKHNVRLASYRVLLSHEFLLIGSFRICNYFLVQKILKFIATSY